MPPDDNRTVMQPPPGGWQNRRADDVRFVQQAEKQEKQDAKIAWLEERNIALELELKRRASEHADIENNQEAFAAKFEKRGGLLATLVVIVGAVVGFMSYEGGFAKAEELKKTQSDVVDLRKDISTQNVSIGKVETKVDGMDRKLDLLLEQSMATAKQVKAPIVRRTTR